MYIADDQILIQAIDDEVLYANTPYTATYTNGRVIEGITDDKGFTGIFCSTKSQDVRVHLHI